MSDKVVVVTTYENFEETKEELQEFYSDKRVLVKFVSKDEFDLMFSKSKDVEVELSDEQFNVLALEAHKRDITFNQLINEIVREEMENH